MILINGGENDKSFFTALSRVFNIVLLTMKNVTGIILDSISDGVFTVDHEWRIMSFNAAAEKITGIPRAEAIGNYCWDVFRANMCEGNCALKRTMNEGEPLVSSSTYIINRYRKRIPITVSTSVLKTEDGNIIGGVETFRDMSVIEELRKELDSRFQAGDMVSRSVSMKRIFELIPHVADSDSTVLIQGETGTGKEILARAIHNASNRKDKPFIAINCGALPDNLLESELFGYKKGAFTNAVKDKPGYFAAASGGTIFLDEIGEVSPAFQVKLLRILESHEYTPLGSVKLVKADIRILAATNKNLNDMVAKGNFRLDLYYRINIVHLMLPPLRDRMEDIPLLVNLFIEKLNRVKGRNIFGVEHEVLSTFMSHKFPGNIRELENIIEHAFVLCREGSINITHLPGNRVPVNIKPLNSESITDAVKSVESQVIIEALQRNNYNRTAAAIDLGMHKSTLFRKIKKLGITLNK